MRVDLDEPGRIAADRYAGPGNRGGKRVVRGRKLLTHVSAEVDTTSRDIKLFPLTGIHGGAGRQAFRGHGPNEVIARAVRRHRFLGM